MNPTQSTPARSARGIKKSELIALSSLALAVACALPGRAEALVYSVTDQASLVAALNQINATSDANATIQLDNSFALTTTGSLPSPTVPVTLDTQGFTLTGYGQGTGNGVVFPGTGATLTIVGSLNGGNGNAVAGATSAGGYGLQVTAATASVVNNGTITGGNGGGAAGAGGLGVAQGPGTFVNGATGIITGGISAGATTGGAGVSLLLGGKFTNYGTISGGASQTGAVGTGMTIGSGGTLNNYGTINGGVSTSLSGAVTIVNSGTITGKSGTAALTFNNTGGTTVVNSGTIQGGGAAAITTAASRTLNLELQYGSNIVGDVIAGTSGTQTLTLGGTTDAAFDLSLVGSFNQYQNFNTFQKTGTSTWSLYNDGLTTTPWIIQAGTLQVGNGGTTGSFIGTVTDNANLAFNRSDSFTFVNLINGTGTVTQVGTGTTVLTGTNTYSGGTVIDAGTLAVGSNLNLGDAAGSITFNGGTLNTTGDITTARTVILNGTGTLQTDTTTTLELTGLVSGAGGLVKTSGGTLVLSGDDTYTGGTTINTGTLQIGNGGTTGSIVGNVTNNWALVFNRSNVLTYAGAISGSGSVAQSGTGTTVLTGTNTYTGGTSIDAGTLQIGNGGTSGSIVGDVTDNGALAFNRSDAATFSGVVSGTGSLAQNGTGTTVLTGTNTYTGGTTINAGTLQLGNGGITGSIDGNVTDNGTLALNRSDVVTFANVVSGSGTLAQNGSGTTVLTGTNTYTGGTTINAGALQIGNGGTSGSIVGNVTNNAALAFNRSDVITFAGVVSGTGSLAQNGTGTTVLTGTNTYTGGTTINSGTLQVGNGGTSGSIVGDVTNNAAIVFDRSDALVYGGAISGTGTLSQNGTGITALTGNSTYTGGTTINAGTLQIGNGGSTGSIATDVTNNGTLAFNRSDAYTFGNVISGSGSVSQSGAGTTTLTGINTYTGGTTINAGTLSVGSDANLGAAAGGITFNGGTLNTTANITSARGVSLNGNGTLQTDTATTLNLTGMVSGNGGLVKSGAGTLLLSGTNTYTGGTAINAGTLQLGNGGTTGSIVGNVVNNAALVFDRSDAVTFGGVVSGTGSLAQNGTGTTVLTGANTYTGGTTISAGTLQLGNGGTNGSIVGDVTDNAALVSNRSDAFVLAGVISGTGSLLQAGSGTTVLAGNNTYTGGTTISGGTLQLGNGGTSGSVVGGIANSGTLVFDRSDMVDFTNAITGNGSVVQAGTGNTVFNTAQTYTGGTTINAGTLSVNGSITSAVQVNAAGTLGGTGTIFGNVTNAGTVAPGNSIGTLTVAGNYIGQGGTLAIQAVLGEDTSSTDRLVVTGNTSGNTNVKVTNIAGAGAPTVEGIRIINVQGASNGSFSLLGDYVYQGQQAVVAGAYAYRLYQGGVSTPTDGNWYLRSESTATTTPPVTTPPVTTPPVTTPPVTTPPVTTPTDPTTPPVTTPPATTNPAPLYAPTVPLYEAYAGVLQRLNQIGTLQQREGNPDFNGASTADPHSGAAWVRVYTDHADLSPETSTTGTSYGVTTQKVQVGVDGMLHEGSSGVLVAGLTAQSGQATSNVASSFGEGRIKTDGYGVGATLTWYGASGFYVDGVAQWNRYRSDIDSYTLARQVANNNHASGVDLSAEAGQKFALNDEWSLIPQGQLTYSSVRFDGFTDAYGAAVSRQDGDSLTARAGLAVDHESSWHGDAGMNRAHVYGIANLYYDFMDGTKTDVSGLTLNSKNAPLWGGLGIGGSLAWKDGRYRLFGEALAQTSVQHFGDSSSYSLRVGFNMRW
ncbi:autotransporter outer membrane beta-barrel domain-containing protein [Dyella telluris]|uniref:Autotransporter outer membrane beta-barrel domain-containing protein n=1 Tax=Dyella telluris TaxID=2763498 RepID=A0A7G8Q1M6_9GAMM|nr:autotransporter outer membrane beta-barrel domain-containing protein [Dyella telluris]QNK00684.1 autotransporter outer membrane beta-barrel domain-containing protein [Dyella telluris]